MQPWGFSVLLMNKSMDFAPRCVTQEGGECEACEIRELGALPMNEKTTLAIVAAAVLDIFLSSKCTKCHSIKAAGIERQKSEDEDMADPDKKQPPDLSDVGTRRDSEWLHGWLTKEITNDDGKKHKMRFRGEEEELDALVEFLLSQKAAK